MDARVKQSYRFGTMQLFSGHEYVKFEFRPVPTGHENEAAAEESLEVREVVIPAMSISQAEIIEEKFEAVEKPARKRHAKAED